MTDRSTHEAGSVREWEGPETRLWTDKLCLRCRHPACPCCGAWCDRVGYEPPNEDYVPDSDDPDEPTEEEFVPTEDAIFPEYLLIFQVDDSFLCCGGECVYEGGTPPRFFTDAEGVEEYRR